MEIKPQRKRTSLALPIIILLTLLFVPLFYEHYMIFVIVLSTLLSIAGIWYIVSSSNDALRALSTDLVEVDQMSDNQFIDLLVPLFKQQGYSVSKTMTDEQPVLLLRKKGIRAIVQAERQTDDIKTTTIQAAISKKSDYRATRAIVVTNRYFTKEAQKLARENKVNLIDRESLDAMIDVYLRDKWKLDILPQQKRSR